MLDDLHTHIPKPAKGRAFLPRGRLTTSSQASYVSGGPDNDSGMGAVFDVQGLFLIQ